MKKMVYSSDRTFKMWDYTVSLGQLLLRSEKSKTHDTTIDIIFYDTSFLQLYWLLEAVKISSINKHEYNGYKMVSKYLNYPNNNLFQIESEGDKYYIAASFVKVYKNDFDYQKTSLNMDDSGRGIVIAASFDI